jgi:hypothetical protein
MVKSGKLWSVGEQDIQKGAQVVFTLKYFQVEYFRITTVAARNKRIPVRLYFQEPGNACSRHREPLYVRSLRFAMLANEFLRQ